MRQIRELLHRRLVAEGLVDPEREHVRLALHLPGDPSVLGVLERQTERECEREQHEERERQVRQQEAAPHGRGSRSRSRYPTPRTVSIQAGSPSLRRRLPMWTSSVFVGPYQCGSQTWSMMSCRLHTAPRVGGQEREQVELLRRERDLRTVERDASGAPVDDEREPLRPVLGDSGPCARPRVA